MKKVVNVGIGGKFFIIEEDAYHKFERYLQSFKEKTGMGIETQEVLDELEMRVSEIFTESLGNNREVVGMALVNKVIAQLGMPDGSTEFHFNSNYYENTSPLKKLFRDPRKKLIGGVCAGLAAHSDLDLVLVRALAIIALIFTVGFWIYIILWIVIPTANTAAKQCELRGITPTMDNLRKYRV